MTSGLDRCIVLGMSTSTATHHLVIDSEDGSVLAWFPMDSVEDGEYDSYTLASRMALDTGHNVRRGVWTGSRFQVVEDDPFAGLGATAYEWGIL